MGVGDEIMASGQAEEIYAKTGMPVVIEGIDGKPRWHEIWLHNPAIARNGVGLPRIKSGPLCRPYIDYDLWNADDRRHWFWSGWRARDHIGKIYLTETERVADISGFAVIEPNVNAKIRFTKPYADNRDWGFSKWQAVVDATPEIFWVQLVPNEREKVLSGVTVIITETFRRACGILSHAMFYAGHEGGMHHAAAALKIPGVVVMGGFPSEQALGYPIHTNLGGDGCGALFKCEHCRQAMDAITVLDVVSAIKAL